MIWYLLIATFLFFGYFSKQPKRYYTVSLIILFVFTGFRDITLGDYNNDAYIAAFNGIGTLQNFVLTSKQPFEMGFMLFVSLCKTICNDFRFFQVAYTLITIVLLHLVIKKMQITNRQKCLFLFVYFCMRFIINNWIILRQNIALLLIWNILLTDKLPLKQTLLNKVAPYIVSCFFHITSIFNAICILAINKLKLLNKKTVYMYTILLSAFFLFSSEQLFVPLMNIMIQIGGDKFDIYKSGSVTQFNYVYYLIRIIILTYMLLFYRNIKYEKKELLFAINVMAVVVGSINVAIFSRFMEYLMIGPYLMITISENEFNRRDEKFKFLLILYVVLMIILIRSLYTYGVGFLLNYSFFK